MLYEDWLQALILVSRDLRVNSTMYLCKLVSFFKGNLSTYIPLIGIAICLQELIQTLISILAVIVTFIAAVCMCEQFFCPKFNLFFAIYDLTIV